MKILTLSAAALMLSFSAGAAYADHHKGHDKGPITKAEFMAKSEKRFDMMDANKDGTLTKDERKGAMKKMMEKHGKKWGGKDGKKCDKHKKHRKDAHKHDMHKHDDMPAQGMHGETAAPARGEHAISTKRPIMR
jgi:hypothetical protein